MPEMTLLDMPEKPMKRIMAACDFRSILSLHKTCHQIRSFIKTHKPGPQIVQIGFTRRIVSTGNHVSIFLSMIFDMWHKCFEYIHPCEGCCKMYYVKKRNDCVIVYNQWEDYKFKNRNHNRKVIKDQDYMEVFMRDLQVYMDLQKSPVYEFQFCAGTIISEMFHKTLESRSPENKFRAHKIHFQSYTQQQILDVLPYFCPETLDHIGICCFEDLKKSYMTLDDVAKTEHWKRAKRIKLTSGEFVVPIDNFVHLNRGYVVFETCTVEQLKVLKEAFLSSNSTSKHFCLAFTNWSEQDEIKQFLDPIHETDITNHRYLYRRPHNPCQILRIEFKKAKEYPWNNKIFEFDIIDIEKITEDEKAMLPKIEVQPKKILMELIKELSESPENLEEIPAVKYPIRDYTIGLHCNCHDSY